MGMAEVHVYLYGSPTWLTASARAPIIMQKCIHIIIQNIMTVNGISVLLVWLGQAPLLWCCHDHTHHGHKQL